MPLERPNADSPAYPFDQLDFQPTTGEQVAREQFSGLSKLEYAEIHFTAAWIIALSEKADYNDNAIVKRAASLGCETADILIEP